MRPSMKYPPTQMAIANTSPPSSLTRSVLTVWMMTGYQDSIWDVPGSPSLPSSRSGSAPCGSTADTPQPSPTCGAAPNHPWCSRLRCREVSRLRRNAPGSTGVAPSVVDGSWGRVEDPHGADRDRECEAVGLHEGTIKKQDTVNYNNE